MRKLHLTRPAEFHKIVIRPTRHDPWAGRPNPRANLMTNTLYVTRE